MRARLPERLEAGRVRDGYYGSDPTWGGYGAFELQGPCGERLRIIASAGDDGDKASDGWEHVSVSIRRRIPNWLEMSFVKDLFWAEDELVVQFHPPRAEYVNNHPHCLHLWRPRDGHIRLPPADLVGIKALGELPL